MVIKTLQKLFFCNLPRLYLISLIVNSNYFIETNLLILKDFQIQLLVNAVQAK